DPPVDGWLLPRPPRETLAENTRPLIVGTNLHEMLMYVDADADAAAWAARLAELVPDAAARDVVNARLGNLPPRRRLDVLETAAQFFCPSLRLADVAGRKAPVWVYRFDRVRGDTPLGAYHGAEIPYVFGTHDAWLPSDAEDRALTELMMAHWVAFARRGDPNAPDLPPWRPWQPGDAQRLLGADAGSDHETADRWLCELMQDERG
ncbi:MAG: carboxylesterase family protein, partial [Pseudomonadales bacterium]